MRKLTLTLAVLLCVLSAVPAHAEIGTADNVPAATLLIPYFEVDLNNLSGITTLFSINNASSSSALAHVTLWTDWGIPTFAFQVYLTGFDVQTINMRDIFNGVLPQTADGGIDPDSAGPSGNAISNRGNLSQTDANFGGSVGPCGDASTVYGQPDPTLPEKIFHIQQAHTGQFSPVFGACGGHDLGDNVARGYVTVDVVNACTLDFPSSPGYFAGGVARFDNVLWGDVLYVNPGQNFAQGDTAVHIEACVPGNGFSGYVGNGAGHCPFGAGDYTFYGRYVGALGSDQREPLATTFATRYANGGNFDGGTSLLVWRDTKKPPTGASGPRPCGAEPDWFPLAQTDVVSFDEQENATDQCFLVDNVAPPVGGVQTCFPLATQRIHTAGGNFPAEDMNITTPFGWLYLNLNFALSGDPYPGVAQAWVQTHMDAEGRFSVGFSAIQLDNALTQIANGQILLP